MRITEFRTNELLTVPDTRPRLSNRFYCVDDAVRAITLDEISCYVPPAPGLKRSDGEIKTDDLGTFHSSALSE